MKNLGFILTSALSVLALVSCEKNLEVAGAAEGNSTLTIKTRAASNDEKLSYPVTVYAMNDEGQCVRRLQLNSADDQLLMKLQPMSYHIYAIGGAVDGDYSLPGQNDAATTSPVSLNDDEQHGDLMTASNTVTISDSEDATLTLTMSRKVMELEDVSILNVPKSVTAVSVALSPIYDDLLLNGSYSTGTSTQTIALTEQADGTTWKNADALYMLPSSGNATVTVKFSRGDAITSYSYASPLALEANKHIRIKGTFTGTDQLSLVGTITGAKWDGTTTIEFTFDENGSAADNGSSSGGDSNGDDDDGIEEGSAPALYALYKGCFVNAVADDDTGEYDVVTLIHKSQVDISGSGKTEAAILSEIEEALPTFNINGITGWRLPTSEEASTLQRNAANALFREKGGTEISGDYYYYMNGNTLKTFSIGSIESVLDRPSSAGQHLRPVTTVKFRK